MDVFEAMKVVSRNGVAVLRVCHTRSPHAVASTLGISLLQAKRLTKVAAGYLGSADSPRKQRETIEHAERAGFSVERLMMIDRYARKVAHQRGAAWSLRLELCKHRGSFDDVSSYASRRVPEICAEIRSAQQLNSGSNKEDCTTPTSTPTVRITRAVDGMRSLILRDTERRITNLEKTLHELILRRAQGDQPAYASSPGTTNLPSPASQVGPENQASPSNQSGPAASADPCGELPRSRALAKAFWELLEDGGALITPTYSTVITVSLDKATRVLKGTGDDVTLQLSDGTSMTGTEWLETLSSFPSNTREAKGSREPNSTQETGGTRRTEIARVPRQNSGVFVGLFHPVSGPVNLYEMRFASWKQRILAMAETTECAWPGCHVPADRCEVHHIRAHAHGGQTEPGNLTMLCKHHNGANDDNPNAPPRRGRIARESGKLVYRSPAGKKIPAG